MKKLKWHWLNMEGECESDERDDEVYVGNGFVCFRVKRIGESFRT